MALTKTQRAIVKSFTRVAGEDWMGMSEKQLGDRIHHHLSQMDTDAEELRSYGFKPGKEA